ncbi:MAG: GIY-YIG nuclease family protein, partial [Pseudomonadales bacterium]
ESVQVVDKLNWTGVGIAFPRRKWSDVKDRQEFNSMGIYILCGYETSLKEIDDDIIDEGRPTIYIGQADVLQSRIDAHHKKKDFWDRCVIFTTTNNTLNRAHVIWLEYALIDKAKASGRCHLDNDVFQENLG